MKEIKCPHCKQVFSVDESAFESIALQVRDSLFHDELERREQELRKSVEAEFKMQQALSDKQASAELSKKEADLNAKQPKLPCSRSNFATLAQPRIPKWKISAWRWSRLATNSWRKKIPKSQS